MRKIAFALILLLVLALVFGVLGCGRGVTPMPTPTLIPTPTVAPTPTPTVTPSPTALFLEITQPADGAQVNTSSVLVIGKTIPGAVVSVSVDDEIIEVVNVGQDGKFTVAVTLEEGPNFIEVTASDQQGNEKSSSVAVIYVP